MNRSISITFVATMILASLCFTADAKKPDKPGGGGGGGNALNYDIVHLDDLNGMLADSVGLDINDQQEIVGYANGSESGPSLAVYWTVIDGPNSVETAAHLLPYAGYDEAFTEGINNRTEIVGRGYLGDLEFGLYWPTPDAQPLMLPPLPGDNVSDAKAINNDGIVCGVSWNSLTWTGTPVVWQVTGAPDPEVSNAVELPLPADSQIRRLQGINDLDGDGICQIVGTARSSTASDIPLRWTITSASSALIPAPVAEPLDVEGRADGINNLGEVTGAGLTTDRWEGLVWSGTERYELDRARFIGRAYGYDINDSGWVVGEGSIEKRGTFWYWAAGVWESPQSDMILVEDFLTNSSPFFHLTSAGAVNAGGDIAGGGWTGQYQAYVAIRRQ